MIIYIYKSQTLRFLLQCFYEINICQRYHFKFHMTQFNPSTNIVNQQLRSYIEVRTHAWTWERNFRVMQIFFHFIYYSWCYYFCGIIDVLNSVFGVMEVAYQHCLDWYSSCKLMLARCFQASFLCVLYWLCISRVARF